MPQPTVISKAYVKYNKVTQVKDTVYMSFVTGK